MPVRAVLNNKGGVGKSAVVAALASTFARRGRRVLCVDMDPQANLSRRLGWDDPDDDLDDEDNPNALPTLAEAIKAATPGCAEDVVMRCSWDDPAAALIDFLPSRFDLENRISEAGTVGAQLRLRSVMEGMAERYDWVLIDCPPSLGHLTQMALVAARDPESLLIVVEPEYDAMRGAVRVQRFVTKYAAALGVPDLSLAGVIVNRVRAGTDLHNANLAEIEARFGSLVWEPSLPLWTALADAMNSAVPVHTLPGQRAADLTSRLDALADRMETAR